MCYRIRLLPRHLYCSMFVGGICHGSLCCNIFEKIDVITALVVRVPLCNIDLEIDIFHGFAQTNSCTLKCAHLHLLTIVSEWLQAKILMLVCQDRQWLMDVAVLAAPRVTRYTRWGSVRLTSDHPVIPSLKCFVLNPKTQRNMIFNTAFKKQCPRLRKR